MCVNGVYRATYSTQKDAERHVILFFGKEHLPKRPYPRYTPRSPS